MLEVEVTARLADRSGKAGMEDDLTNLSTLQHLHQARPALLRAAGDGRLAEQLLAVGGVAGTSLAGAEELNKRSERRETGEETHSHGWRQVQGELVPGKDLPAGRDGETLQTLHCPGGDLGVGRASVFSEP